MLRTSSLLVRHLTFLAEPVVVGAGPRSGSRAVVSRCRRAWLPPSAVWLFAPRSYSHDIGGWYVEWVGERCRQHPAWLHPAVIVLAAAFDTLDHERAQRQPRGLFGWLRHSGRPGPASAAAWLRSMLHFHRKPGSG